VTALDLSGDTFAADYDIQGSAEEARARADDICIEQTVEFPPDLIARDDIRTGLIGRLDSLEDLGDGRHRARVRFAVETAGVELTQLLNVLFGNTSIKPGIRLARLHLPDSLLRSFAGPRFGRTGLRELTGARERPLLCTAVKPMGLSPRELADLAYGFARGGVDLIKDDHGLADQPFCRFDERVRRCAEAVARANAETGGHSLYVANVSAGADCMMERARRAKAAGAGALMVAPGLVGFDAMRMLADSPLELPILFHPALLGTYTVHPNAGIGHGVLYGQLCRLAGADATIFPHFGGRFAFGEADCRDLVDGCHRPMGELAPIFPVPAGGMSLERAPELLEFYGRDVILLVGGDLHRHGSDLTATCRRFREVVEKTP
jgi:ribulose-bisphosphate carboxylase large chain